MRRKTGAALAVVVGMLWAACAGAEDPKPAASRITVDSSQCFQTIDGFGVNFAGPYFRDDQKPMFDMLIDDLGVSMFRLAPYLVYTDWEVNNDNDDPEVMNWEYYNERYSSPLFEPSWKAIRYLNGRGIKPMLALWGRVPPWMLDDKSTPPTHAVGDVNCKIPPLKPAMYPEFAEEVVSMLMYARSHERLEFEYFSPFNETDCYPNEGPRIDPEEAPKVLAAVAKRLKKEGLDDVRLAVADQALIVNDYITPIMKDPQLMRQVGAFTFHSYIDKLVDDQVARIKASQYPHIPVWLTEYGDLDEDRSADNDWKKHSLKTGRKALIALNQGANALFYFNAFDDYEECAQRFCYYGLIHSSDHVYYPKKRYFATKQLYHFVRPGSRRVATTAEGQGLTTAAFQTPAPNSLVIVGVKESGPNHIQINLQGPAPLPDHLDLYLTTRSVNCIKQGTIPVREGVVELDLPDEAVFTLVGPTNLNPK